MKTILNILMAGATLYLIGLAFVMGSIMMGGTGDDELSQHYKGVIGLITLTDSSND